MAKRGRGRPVVYKGNVKKHIVSLVKKYNGQQARAILNARTSGKGVTAEEKELAAKRNLSLVPEALNISLPTIYGYAEEASVELRRGRPSAAA